MPRAQIFARTGIQFLQFNTLYQLAAHVAEGLPGGPPACFSFPISSTSS